MIGVLKLSYKSNDIVIERLKNLVVRIEVLDEKNEVLKIGTGMFLDETHILTANHVVCDALEPENSCKVLVSKDNTFQHVNVIVKYNKPNCDANILEIVDDVSFAVDNYVGLVKSAFRKRGFEYAAYGYPRIKADGHYQRGKVLDESIDINGQSVIDLSLGEGRLNDYRGFSGSPVVCNGQLIGIAIEQSVGLNLAQSIKVLEVVTFVHQIDDRWIDEDSFIEGILTNYLQYSNKEIEQNKSNKKYIPDIFVEMGDMKEQLRGFTDPILFFNKHLDYIKRHHFTQYNSILEKYGLPQVEGINGTPVYSLNEVKSIADKMIVKLEDMQEYVESLTKSTDIRTQIPEEYLELFDMSYYGHRLYGMTMEIRDRIKLFNSIIYKQIVLTERAGQGKTNLLCDFVENVLLKKEIPTLFVSTRNFHSEDLSKTLIGLSGVDITFSELIEVLEYIAQKKQYPFVLVLDAINEQKDVLNSKVILYRQLNKLNESDNIKILMTARTEYFEEKFGDLESVCPQVKLFSYYNRYSQEYKLNTRVFSGYLKHFNIRIDDIGDSIYDQLSTDYLLLRMFSEAYQGSESETTVIPALLHLFRFEIFEKYYTFKKDNLKEWDRMHGVIDSGSTYDCLINTVTDFMIGNMKFGNIERTVISDGIENELLVKLIDEDIVFRDDLIVQKGLVERKAEVINFTFDEFRDYCIAKKLIESFDKDNVEEIESLITKLTSSKNEASEGIQKYLFFASKKYQEETFQEMIIKQKWFYKIYFENIFSVNEEYIQDRDLNFIGRILSDMNVYEPNKYIVVGMFSSLIKRYNTTEYTKLNILFLIHVLEKIKNEDFYRYIQDIFRPSYEDRYSYYDKGDRIPKDKLINRLKVYFERSFSEDIVYFLGYLHHRGIYVHDFFDWCIENYPDKSLDVFTNGVNSKTELKSLIFKEIVRGITYYEFELDEEQEAIWTELKESCVEVKEEYEGANYSEEQVMEIYKQLTSLYKMEEVDN